MGSSSDDILSRLLNTGGWVACGRSRRFFGARDVTRGLSIAGTSAGIISWLLNAGWVASGRNDRWDTSASNVIGNEASNRRDRRGWDREELAGINIVDEAEEDTLAVRLGIALGHAECCSFCERTS